MSDNAMNPDRIITWFLRASFGVMPEETCRAAPKRLTAQSHC
jgi:hypothetical protein